MEELKELKAQAYDKLAELQKIQNELQVLNQKIFELSKEEQK